MRGYIHKLDGLCIDDFPRVTQNTHFGKFSIQIIKVNRKINRKTILNPC